MLPSKLQIINNVLTAAGFAAAAGPNAGFRWTTLARHYDALVRAELESGNYQFTVERHSLSTAGTASFGFDYAWVLPNDAIFIRAVYESDVQTSRDWTVHRGLLYIDADSGLSIDALLVPDEQHWSNLFALGIQQACEGVAYRALRQDEERAMAREQTARLTLAKAAAKSAQQRNPRDAFNSRLLARRLGG